MYLPQVFDTAGTSIVDGVVGGYNGTMICCGRRGAGKTYTMVGCGPVDGHERGLVSRVMARLFTGIKSKTTSTFRVGVSCLQIYCETLQDLLDPAPSRDIVIRERPGGETFVEGLCRVYVTDAANATAVLEAADKRKTQAPAGDSETSSRSHVVMLAYLEQRDSKGVLAQSCMMLADLAGSESAKRSTAQYRRLEEFKSINLSLSALGNCVAALAQRRSHVPFRDSKLTRLLQPSLGGNSRTVMIISLLLGRDDLGETLSSLVFAQRAMSVSIKARVNVVPDLDAMCQDLQKELDKKNDELTEMTLQRVTADENLEMARDEVIQLDAETNRMKSRLESMAAAGSTDLQEMESVQVGGRRRSKRWRESTRGETTEDAEDVTLAANYEERVSAYKAAAASAGAEWSAAQYELTKEREVHLATLRALRSQQIEARDHERETNTRLSELLGELSEREARIDALNGEILRLEKERSEERLAIAREYVSRQEVQEMEALFAAAVEGLSKRLKDMEMSK
ncbi:unnamed protein product, partial [Sphacelaria rigidula]